jgi:hypothetical protein
LADFEGLIRQALARQNANDPAVRERVYQASRNALARMIVSVGAQPPKVIHQQRVALENSIKRIEANYNQPADTQSNQDRQTGASAVHPADQISPDTESDQVSPPPRESQPPTPHADENEYRDEEGERLLGEDELEIDTHRFRQRKLVFAAFLVLLAVIAWFSYALISILVDEPSGTSAQPGEQTRPDAASQFPEESDSAIYVTMLAPNDTGDLQTSGRGTAQIMNQNGMEFIRLTSLRSDETPSVAAEPILLELPPGILEQISGKRITAEIYAKSGGTGPATFVIGCTFDGVEICGRKRFRLGLQPEAIVFTLNIDDTINQDSQAYFMISTDVTTSATFTGEGDSVDILYARLRFERE